MSGPEGLGLLHRLPERGRHEDIEGRTRKRAGSVAGRHGQPKDMAVCAFGPRRCDRHNTWAGSWGTCAVRSTQIRNAGRCLFWGFHWKAFNLPFRASRGLDADWPSIRPPAPGGNLVTIQRASCLPFVADDKTVDPDFRAWRSQHSCRGDQGFGGHAVGQE